MVFLKKKISWRSMVQDKKDRVIKLASEGRIKEVIDEAGNDVQLLFAAIDLRETKTHDDMVIAKRILEIQPENPDAHKICGRLYARLKRYSEAEYEFNEALNNFTDDIKRSEVRTYYANLMNLLERFKEAERQYRKAIGENPGNIEAHRNLGDLLFEHGRYKEAEEEFTKVLNIDPGYSNTQYRLGDTMYELKSYGEAEKAYQKAYSQVEGKKNKEKDIAQVLDHLGKTLAKLKRYGEAREKYETAISLNKYHAGAHNNLGVLLKELGNEEKDKGRRTKLYEDALNEFQTADKIVPHYPVPHNNAGIVLRDLKRICEARESFENALKEDPNFVDAHINLGIMYAEEYSDYKKAIEEFEEAIRIDPRNPNACYNLFLAKMKGKIGEADWWQTSYVTKIAENILVLTIVILIFAAIYSVMQPAWHGSESIKTVETYGNITITTERTNIISFDRTIILIGAVVLLLFLPKIKKLKLAPSGIEFEKESPKDAPPELEK